MTDLNSHGVRAESTRKAQAPIERATPLRAIATSQLGTTHKEQLRAFIAQRDKARAMARLSAVKTSADGKSVWRRLYAAWRARRITDRQAELLGVPKSAISTAAGRRRRKP